MVSAKDFVAYVYVPLREHWGYIYGTAGRMWTAALQEAWSKPGHKNYEQTEKYGAQWIGRLVTDCSGLPCWALKQLGVKDFVHQARYQYTDASGPKGKLIDGSREDGKPVLPGTAVFLQGTETKIHHEGVYVGHGVCIEAKGTRWGVVTSDLSHWDHWGELKVVDYTDAAQLEDEPVPEIEDEVLAKAMVDNPGAWLNVRSGPGTNYPVLFRLEKGDIVEILTVDEEKDWDQIRYGGRTGWASADYLAVLAPEQGEPDGEPDEEDGREDIVGKMREMMDEIRAELGALETLLDKLEEGGEQHE